MQYKTATNQNQALKNIQWNKYGKYDGWDE